MRKKEKSSKSTQYLLLVCSLLFVHHRRVPHHGHACCAQGIAFRFRLGHQQAGACILLQILRVHRHAADQQEWTP
jgi:hypothetical protein